MKQVKGMASAQGGFTLVEIAIVLVIVGLLLGGVLQGQQLIENSRVRGAINDVNGIQAAMTAYQDRYGRLPGDDGPDLAISGRGGAFANPTALTGGNTNGVINGGAVVGSVLTTAPTGEPLLFWQHLRAAGFVSGNPQDTAITALPANAFGGVTNITSVLAVGIPLNQTKLCMSNITGSAARAIDTRLDDGLPNTGRVRASINVLATAPVAVPYVDGTIYSICIAQ